MVRIDPTALKGFVAALLESAGSAPGEAATVSEHLVDSNLKGHDSHGVGMLSIYTDQVIAPRETSSCRRIPSIRLTELRAWVATQSCIR